MTTAQTSTSGRGRGALMGAVALILGIIILVFVLSNQTSTRPFSIDSASPDGFKALKILLAEQGLNMKEVDSDDIDSTLLKAGDRLVVPAVDSSDEAQIANLVHLAEHGVVVVLGSETSSALGDSLESLGSARNRALVERPANLSATGVCSIEELADLGPIDVAFAPDGVNAGRLGSMLRGGSSTGSLVPATRFRTCYGQGLFQFVSADVGSGRLVLMSSPLLWVNARLAPNKEEGGDVLDNAATALRLLGADRTSTGSQASRSVWVSVPTRTTAVAQGTQSPLGLLPTQVKLALVQLGAALAIFLWWRGRRLGKPVAETVPVEIDGSELVTAIGDLLRRKGNPQRAADVLRSETRRELARRFALGPDAEPATVVALVAARTGEDPGLVGTWLVSGPVPDAEALVRLARKIDSIRSEVIDVHASR